MAREINPDSAQTSPMTMRVGESGLVLSPISQCLQQIGRQILQSPGLTEIEEGLFSTCPEPIYLGDRLLRARDMGVPLVEVSTFPIGNSFAIEGGADSRLVTQILRSDGVERYTELEGNHVPYQTISLVIPLIGSAESGDPRSAEITASLGNGRYAGYDKSRPTPVAWKERRGPSLATGYRYERDIDLRSKDRFMMSEVLDKAMHELGITA